MSFSIATLNVHMWVDANHDDRISLDEFLRVPPPIVVCLGRPRGIFQLM